MALVTRLDKADKQRQSVHGETECQYSSFSKDGRSFLQLDTFGSAERKLQGKISQSLQLSREAAQQLSAIIDSVFGR